MARRSSRSETNAPSSRGRGLTGQRRSRNREHTQVGDNVQRGIDVNAFESAMARAIAQGIQVGVTQAQQYRGNPDGSRDQRLIRDKWLSELLKVDPPKFDGTKEKDVDDWIAETESALEGIECPEDRRVPVAQNLLRDAAARWWRSCRPVGRTIAWEEFTGFLRAEYCPEPVRLARVRKFMEMGQQDLPISDIVRQYQLELSYVADMVPTDMQKICHLAQRLPEEVRRYASGFLCSTLREYQNVVLAYATTASDQETSLGRKERKAQRTLKKSKQVNDNSRYSRDLPVAVHPGSSSSSRIATSATGGRRCYNCKSPFHMRNHCPRPPSQCYICGGTGHVADYCLKG